MVFGKLDHSSSLSEIDLFSLDFVPAALQGLRVLELDSGICGESEDTILEGDALRLFFEHDLNVLFADVIWEVEDQKTVVSELILAKFLK